MRGRSLRYLSMAIVAVLAVMLIDLHYTAGQVPSVPPACESVPSPGCNIAERESILERRYDERSRLQDDFATRAWVYAAAQIVAILAAVAAMLRNDPRERRAAWFTELGVLGVCLGLITLFVCTLGISPDSVSPPVVPSAAPTIFALAVAAIGGIGTTVAERRRPTPLPRSALVALGCTGLTFLLAIFFSIPQPSCNSASQAPGWTSPVGMLAVLSSAAALYFGFVSLTERRWFVAASAVVINPCLLIFMSVASGALC